MSRENAGARRYECCPKIYYNTLYTQFFPNFLICSTERTFDSTIAGMLDIKIIIEGHLRNKVFLEQGQKLGVHMKLVSASSDLQLPVRQWGCRQCLPFQYHLKLKGKHCRKPHYCNGIVDHFWAPKNFPTNQGSQS